MTTQLADSATRFFPFNQGSIRRGREGGKGNPANPDGYVTAYLWEKVLTRDGLLDLIHKFICFVAEKEEVERNGQIRVVEKRKLVFPRYHQYDVVNKVVADVKQNGRGQKLSHRTFGGERKIQFHSLDRLSACVFT